MNDIRDTCYIHLMKVKEARYKRLNICKSLDLPILVISYKQGERKQTDGF
jgi:hypothetical protein